MRARMRELAASYLQDRPWRSWPLCQPAERFRGAFGVDTYLYHKLVRDTMVLCVYLALVGSVSSAVYLFLDAVPPATQAASGLFPLFQSYPHELPVVVFQALAVLGHVLFRRGVRAGRKAVTEDESRNVYTLADYTLVLTRIPPDVSDVEVRAFVEGVAREFSEEAGARASRGAGGHRAGPARGVRGPARGPAIARYDRILKPALLGLSKRQAAVWQEYYTKLVEDPDSILRPPRSCFRRFSDLVRLTPLLQRLGAYRDNAYYQRETARVASQIARSGGALGRHTDTAFVTFHDAKVCLFVLWRLKGVPLREARRIETLGAAFSVDDTLEQGDGGRGPGSGPGSGQSCGPDCGARRLVSPLRACGLCGCRAPRLLGKYALSASRAPMPDDVIWQNLHSTATRRFLGSCASFCIALLITGVLVICVLALRQLRREMSQGAGSVFEEYGIYVGMYLVILLFDQGMRPILRWAVTFERQHTYTAQERSFFWKYFFYNLLNRLAPMYSRNFLQLIVPEERQGEEAFDPLNFLDIIRYTKDWRFGRNTAGEDLIMYLIIQIVGYNLLDLLVYGGRIAFLLMTAASDADRRNALQGIPIRYANFYSNLMCSGIIVLAYSYAQPLIVPMFLVYLAVHDLVLRTILLRLAAPPPRTAGSLASEADWILWFGSIFAVACVAQGQIGYGSPWYLLAFLTLLLAFELVFNRWVLAQMYRCLLRTRDLAPASRMQEEAIRVRKVRDMPPFSAVSFGSYGLEDSLRQGKEAKARAQDILRALTAAEGAPEWRRSSRLSAESGGTGGAGSKRSSAALGPVEPEAVGEAARRSVRYSVRSSVRASGRASVRAQVRSSGQALSREAIDAALREAEAAASAEAGPGAAAGAQGPGAGEAGGPAPSEPPEDSQARDESEAAALVARARVYDLIGNDSVDDAD